VNAAQKGTFIGVLQGLSGAELSVGSPELAIADRQLNPTARQTREEKIGPGINADPFLSVCQRLIFRD